MRMNASPHRLMAGHNSQRGVIATFLALVVLIVTLLAVLALTRSVDTGNRVAGTMAFRQGLMQQAEIAYSDAKANLTFAPPTTEADNPGLGYYAEITTASTISNRKDLPALLTAEPVDTSKVATIPTGKSPLAGTTTYYIVERLCPTTGVATVATCIVPGAAITGGTSSNGTSDPGIPFNTTGSAAAFRLTVRVEGPKNSRAYVQTILR